MYDPAIRKEIRERSIERVSKFEFFWLMQPNDRPCVVHGHTGGLAFRTAEHIVALKYHALPACICDLYGKSPAALRASRMGGELLQIATGHHWPYEAAPGVLSLSTLDAEGAAPRLVRPEADER